MLPKEAIKEYQEAFLKDFGYKIPEDEALKQLTNLMDLVRILYKPNTKFDNQKN